MIRKLSLAGKRVFLTGGAPGPNNGPTTLGEQFAEALKAEGAIVYLVDINPRVREAALRLNANYRIADVTDLDEMEYTADLAADTMGGIDIVIANAGVADITTFENDPTRYSRIQAVNETGVYNTIRACMPYIKGEDKYVLVNASNGGIVPLFLMMAYNASKAHAIKLAESCNLELMGTGARCGVLLLSEHVSPMEDNFKKSIPRFLMEHNPLLKYGHRERDARHAVNGMIRAIKRRRLYTSVPRYSVLARYFPASVGWVARQMHRAIQPVADRAREEYEQNQ